MVLVSHPPYSPDIATCDFCFIPTDEENMKGKWFADVDDLKEKTQEAVNSIPAKEFQKCFQLWKIKILIDVLNQVDSILKETRRWTCDLYSFKKKITTKINSSYFWVPRRTGISLTLNCYCSKNMTRVRDSCMFLCHRNHKPVNKNYLHQLVHNDLVTTEDHIISEKCPLNSLFLWLCATCARPTRH